LIKLFYDNTEYILRGSKKALNLIREVIGKENRISGDLNFIITGDENIKEINREFLNHDYYTDVIAFGYNEGKTVSGEIYISIDTVKKNSNNYKVSLRSELIRVMVHGTLHLCGYEDRNIEERKIMKNWEDHWIGIFDKKS
jgi:probable rRNA maturation factor